MLLKQITVFLENKPGRLSDFVKLLAAHNIDLQALSIAENTDYGLLRIIADDTDKALTLLKDENWPCKSTEVLAVSVPDEPGSLTHILGVLAEHNISINYSYAFFSREQGRAFIVLRVEDNAEAEKLLIENGIIA